MASILFLTTKGTYDIDYSISTGKIRSFTFNEEEVKDLDTKVKVVLSIITRQARDGIIPGYSSFLFEIIKKGLKDE